MKMHGSGRYSYSNPYLLLAVFEWLASFLYPLGRKMAESYSPSGH